MGPEVIAGISAGVVVLLVLWYILRKGRRLPGTHVFRASRISKGNRIFPAQVVISESSITHLKPQWIGKHEESIHISHVASIRIDTNILYSDVFIESTGGQNPIECYGHSKREAIEIKRLVEQFQSAFYRRGAPESDRPAAS
ncbi:MAG: hypothetical protein IT183_10185 [Acidobacteria bacterium]|nr:hypothetical protein [Acidobacteriota bacterium]